MQVKGVEFGKHDPRLKPALAIGFALSFVGADHVLGVHDTSYVQPGRPLDILHAFGFHETMPLKEMSVNKARVFYYGYQFTMAKDCLGMCHFLPWTAQELVALVSNVTGWDTSCYEVAKVAERAFCMGREFNAREGFTAEDDVLPERFFQPTTSGAHHVGGLDRDKWLETRNAAYGIFGWDPQTGAPTRGKLDELGLSWVDTPHP
jgi:aldehyde:ferredoxin oxidoreductase